MHHSEFFQLFNAYWFLLIVLALIAARLARVWMRHVRAQQTLDMIKSYVDQGKEPPPILLQTLQVADQNDGRFRNRGPGIWIPICLFASLSAAFTFMASRDSWDEGHIFVAIIMGGLALGFLTSSLARRSDDRMPPP